MSVEADMNRDCFYVRGLPPPPWAPREDGRRVPRKMKKRLGKRWAISWREPTIVITGLLALEHPRWFGRLAEIAK